MFLMPVALFVILYSVPRFFELETQYVERSLCPPTTTTTTTTPTPMLTTITSLLNASFGEIVPVAVDDTDVTILADVTDVTILADGTIASPSSLTLTSTSVSTPSPCKTIWKPSLGVRPLRFNPYYVSVSHFLNLSSVCQL